MRCSCGCGCDKPWQPPAAFLDQSLLESFTFFTLDVANCTAVCMLSEKLLPSMVTLPPPVLIVTPVPSLECMEFRSTRIWELFHEETPSPRAPCISLCIRTTRPLLATTLAPHREKAIVLPTASSRPR